MPNQLGIDKFDLEKALRDQENISAHVRNMRIWNTCVLLT